MKADHLTSKGVTPVVGEAFSISNQYKKILAAHLPTSPMISVWYQQDLGSTFTYQPHDYVIDHVTDHVFDTIKMTISLNDHGSQVSPV